MGAMKDAFDIAKELISTAKGMADTIQATEFCSKLLDLQSMILDAREENQQLKDQIDELKQKIEELKKNDLPSGTKWSVGGIGMYVDSNGKKNYICRHCYEDLHRIFHTKMIDDTYFECPKCKQGYYYYTSE